MNTINNNNKFTVTGSDNNVQSKTFRADLCLQQQQVAVAKSRKGTHDHWVHQNEDSRNFLRPEDASWSGKALLSEAIRYQYSHKSKRLTKTLIERCPLLAHSQTRYEEDVAFTMEETLRVQLVERAVSKKIQKAAAVGETLSEEEIEDVREALDRQIDAPEIHVRDIVAPMAPELANAMWADFDISMGISPMVNQKKTVLMHHHQQQHYAAHQGGGSQEEMKVMYAKSMGSFTQMQLWRVRKSKSKY